MSPSRLRPRARALVFAPLLALTACSTGGDPASTGPHPVRFVLQADEREPGPVFIQLNTETRPVGWLTLLRDGEPVAFAPRCEVPDCGQAAEAVCGAALPRVRELTGGSGRQVEYEWDGRLSRTTAGGCEVLEAAPAGSYVARICHARSVRPLGPPAESDSGIIAGRVQEPRCVERTFTLPTDREVRVEPDPPSSM